MKNYIKTFMKYRYMLILFIKRDIEKKYNGAVLGILWSLLNPLLNMIVLSIVFSTLFKRDIDNFPLYLISARIVFNFFASTTSASMRSVVGSAALLKKINFPKYMVVLSTVLSNFIIFGISFLDLFLIMFLTNAKVNIYFLTLPFLLALLCLFVLGFSLMLSIINAYFRDMQHLYSIFIMVLTYFSAIFYPVDIIPDKFQFIFYINPVYQFIKAFRDIVYYGNLPTSDNLSLCILYTVLSLIIGIWVFIRHKDKIIIRL